jgi:hypothetical protein
MGNKHPIIIIKPEKCFKDGFLFNNNKTNLIYYQKKYK